jgi:hypothetical protein
VIGIVDVIEPVIVAALVNGNDTVMVIDAVDDRGTRAWLVDVAWPHISANGTDHGRVVAVRASAITTAASNPTTPAHGHEDVAVWRVGATGTRPVPAWSGCAATPRRTPSDRSP